MNTDAIIKQLEKALAKKDDKELRLRVEVLVEILKESRPAPLPVLPAQPAQPATPLRPYYDSTPTLKPPYEVTAGSNRINGAGPIVGGGEQINYKRPKGT